MLQQLSMDYKELCTGYLDYNADIMDALDY